MGGKLKTLSGAARGLIASLAVALASFSPAIVQADPPTSFGGTTELPFIQISASTCNGKDITGVTTTNTSAVISSSAYTFLQKDVGKYITVPAAGAGGGPLNATISSVSAGAATLSVAASASIAGTGTATFGTDSYTKINAQITKAGTNGGGNISLPKGKCILSQEIINIPSKVSMQGQGWDNSIIEMIKLTDQSAGILEGVEDHVTCNAANAALQVGNEFHDFQIDATPSTLAVYTVSAKGIAFSCNTRSKVHDVYVHDTPATCIATDFGINTDVSHNLAINCGRLGGNNFGSNGIGEAIGGIAGEAYTLNDNIIVNPAHFGIFLESQSGSITQPAAVTINDNIVFEGANSQAGTGNTSGGVGNAGSVGMVISSNYIFGLSSSSSNWAGIKVGGGTLGNTESGVQTVVTGNYVKDVSAYGIGVDYFDRVPGGNLQAMTDITGNTVINARTFCYELLNNATVNAMNNVNISSNIGYNCGSAGLGFIAGTNHQAKNITASNNLFANNGDVTGTDYRKSGMAFAFDIDHFTAIGNRMFDDGNVTQKYAFGLNAGVTLSNVLIANNDLAGNTTTVFNGVGTVSGRITNNIGYNPVGIGAVAVGASPFTYTAGNSSETLYISAGTVTSIVKGGNNLGIVAGVVNLEPGDAVTITYAVAPTVQSDIH